MNPLTSSWQKLQLLYQTRTEPEKVRVLAELLWRALLGLTLVSIVLVLVFGAWAFFGVLDDLSSPQGGGATPPVALDRSALKDTLSSYVGREAAYEAAQRGGGAFPDPSR